MKKIKISSLVFLTFLTLGTGLFVNTTDSTVEAAAYGDSWYIFPQRFFGYPPRLYTVASNSSVAGRPGTLVDVAYIGGGYYMGYYKAWY